MRVRVCARERAVIGIFTFHISHFAFPLSSSTFLLIHFAKKRPVVLWKTSRRFEENNPSFYEKQAVALYKSLHRWKQRKKSSTHNLHKYEYKENFSRTKPKEMGRKQEKRCRKTKEKQWGYCKAKKAFTPYLPKKSLLKQPIWYILSTKSSKYQNKLVTLTP